MAIVGQALTAPEAGWRRVDNTDLNIVYTGNVSADSGTSSYYLSTVSILFDSNAKLTFNFTGTKFRLIGDYYTGSSRSNSIDIYIDGAKVLNFSQVGNALKQALQCDIDGLEDKEHYASIINNCTNSGNFRVDAIDIASDAYLRPYDENPKTKICKSIDEMTIGDLIPYRYTAASGVAGAVSELGACTATEIPYTGSATPNGLAFFRKVDKGLLISDRVVQHSISWDALNSAKYIQGKPLLLNAISSMTANSSLFGIANAISIDGSNYLPYLAFDNDPNTYWQTTPNTYPVWLSYQSFMPFISKGYSLTAGPWGIGANGFAMLPKNWTFEGSNNGINWIILDTQTNQSSWTTSQKRIYSFNNTQAYSFYRLNISANNGKSKIIVTNLEILYDTKSIIRSLSGGNAYLGTDGNKSLTDAGLGAWPVNNEWDKYIVNSDLDGKIIPGDDNVWHWIDSSNLATWCKDTPILSITAAANRTIRGFKNIFKPIFVGTSNANQNIGFRPVLEYLESNAKAKTLWY